MSKFKNVCSYQAVSPQYLDENERNPALLIFPGKVAHPLVIVIESDAGVMTDIDIHLVWLAIWRFIAPSDLKICHRSCTTLEYTTCVTIGQW